MIPGPRDGTSTALKRRRVFCLIVVAVFLSGCAAPAAYREGQTLVAEGKIEEGLVKLEEAVRLNPKNVEYRIALAGQRMALVNRLVATGEQARREGRLSEAEKAYRRVQTHDPNHEMARQGLEALAVERRHRQVVSHADALFKKGGATEIAEAHDMVRSVLAENPNQRDALGLKRRIDDARAAQREPEAELAAAYRKPVTLEFRDAPLKSVFDAIAKVSGLSFFFDKDIRPDVRVTILAKDTSIEDAVRMLLVTNQLEQKILNEQSVLIYPNSPQKLKDYQTLAVRSFYLANADVKAVANTIKTIVKTQDLVVDERLGIIIMRDTPEAIRIAERLITLQDLSDPEVMLEVEVLEIKRSRLLELGIRWPDQVTFGPLSTGGPLTLEDLVNLNRSTTQVIFGNFAATARKEDQDGNILANPRIRVRNKDKAQILIGDRVPVITTTSTSTGFVSESVSYVDVGLKLEVEPTIYLDEEVAIKIQLEVSSLVREVISKSGTLSYQIGTRSANTVLRLKDGETQILAGLISNEDRATANMVPGLGELPVLGRLFGSRKDDSQRSEVILSITPRLVRTLRRPDILLAEFDSGTATAIGAGKLVLGTAARDTGTDAKADDAKSPGPGTAYPAPAGSAQAPPAVAAVGPVSLSWQAPAEVRAGEQFSAVLVMTSQPPLSGMPLLVGFDPRVLQVVTVEEGSFFKQGGGQTTFSSRVDPLDGKVYVAAVRQSVMGYATGINGTGTVLTVTFKAIKGGTATAVQLLSATPEPAQDVPVAVPLEHTVRINP